ncbi:MAG: molecular chaperone TorD family protein [Rhodospirillales bacterium]|nr:molecular chaperone TorD family protein [Rhodospirillales bacterium]
MAQARSNVYGLLASVFRAEPTTDFVNLLKSPEMSDAVAGLGISIEQILPDLPEDKLAEDLAVEYTRLFIGPGSRISPYESIHVENESNSSGEFWGKQTAEVKVFIEAAGLKYADDYVELPDHVSAEMEFMQRLASFESKSRREGKNEDAMFCKGIQKRFYDEHLSKWIPQFCEKIIDRSETPFFKEMAELTRDVIEFERENFSKKSDA